MSGMKGCIHVCREKKCKSKSKGERKDKVDESGKNGKGAYKGRTSERDMLPHPAARLLARGPMEASGSIISSRGAPESPSPPCLGSPPSPCEARSGMSSTRAEGTDRCPRPPLPGASEGARLCTPKSPPSLRSRDRRGKGLHRARRAEAGEDPTRIPSEGGLTWHGRPWGWPGPPPRPHLSPTIITAQQAAPRVTLEATWVPTRGHARRRASTHKAGPQPPRWRGCGGAGHGVWHRESDLR